MYLIMLIPRKQGRTLRYYNYLSRIKIKRKELIIFKIMYLIYESIILKSGQNLGGISDSIYKDVFKYLGGIEITSIVKSNLNCTHEKYGGNFYWEGNQAPMANYINDEVKKKYGKEIASPRSKNTKSGLIDDFIKSPVNKSSDHIIALCRVLKYMGDKSHIVAAIILLYLEESPYIVQTIDRLLSKSIIQVIEYCKSKNDDENYKFISKNLGVMISGGELNKPQNIVKHLLLMKN